MTFRRFAVSLGSVCALFACSNADPIVALNVSAGADVPVVDQLHVTFTQGSRRFVYDFTPPSDAAMGDAGPSIQDSFFERITLPSSFEDQDALIHVEALKTGRVPFDPALTDETTVHIEADGVVAAFVKLEFPTAPPATGGDAGAGGEGGALNEGGASGEGGVVSGGAAAGEAGSVGGGVAGEGGEAGAVSDGGAGG